MKSRSPQGNNGHLWLAKDSLRITICLLLGVGPAALAQLGGTGGAYTGSTAPEPKQPTPYYYPGGGGGADSNEWIRDFSQFVDQVVVNISESPDLEPFNAKPTFVQPTIVQSGSVLQDYAEVYVTDDDGDLLAFGDSEVEVHWNTGAISLRLNLEEDFVARALEQNIRSSGGVLEFTGELIVEDLLSGTSAMYSGGWRYSTVTGLQLQGNTEPGFVNEIASMLHISLIQRAAPNYSLATIFSFLGNRFVQGINYFLDLFIPYTPPSNCSGPLLPDQATCDDEDIEFSCRDRIAEMCEAAIDQIPGVSQLFKKCMKGRCGCGGSSHGRNRIKCARTPDCGPCGGGAGCNTQGSQSWYCDFVEESVCPCMNTVFHEMSHACGTHDGLTGALSAYRIGNWFESQAIETYPEECIPVENDENSP